MFLTRSEYDRGVNTFSPEGRLYQVEYAIEAIKLGSTAIGICTKDKGAVIACEKRITSSLMVPSSIEKIVEVDKHIGCVTSGLMADARTLLERARVECQNHWFVYNEPMPVESCVQAVGKLAIQFGDSDSDGPAMSRPFGVAMLFVGCEEGKVELWHMDPSGTYTKFNAKAIGSGSEGAQQTLEGAYNDEMTLEEAIQIALSTLKQVMEETLSATNVEVMTMAPGGTFKMMDRQKLQQEIEQLG